MKTSNILIVFLFAFATKTSFFALAQTSVLDINGNEVETGVEYYVRSYIGGAGGGDLYFTFDPDKRCPEIVVQNRSDLPNGVPVTFSTVNSSEDIVYENANVTLTFNPHRHLVCKNSAIWQVVYDESTGKKPVTLGGVGGESATEFTLKKHADFAYKFNHNGNDIGRTSDSNGLIRLAVDDEYPWGWVFVKANNTKTIKQVVNV